MAEYIVAPIIPEDPDELKAYVADYLRSKIEGWQPAEGNLDWWIAEAFAELIAQLGEQVTDVQASIFRYFGASLIGLPPIAASSASGTVTIYSADARPVALPEGTLLEANTGGRSASFELAQDVTIPGGTPSVASIPIRASDPGADGNGYTGSVDLLEPVDTVDRIALDAPTDGGQDEEADDVYLVRLRDELRLLTPRPILPEDFAVLARRQVGVERALPIDGYDAQFGTSNVARCVTLVLLGPGGSIVQFAAHQAVRDNLEAMREANFIVRTIDPSLIPFDVDFQITVWDGYDHETTRAAVEASIRSYLSPASWGQPPTGESSRWVQESTVRYLNVARAALLVEGVKDLTLLKVWPNNNRTGTGTADYVMPGVGALPDAQTVQEV